MNLHNNYWPQNTAKPHINIKVSDNLPQSRNTHYFVLQEIFLNKLLFTLAASNRVVQASTEEKTFPDKLFQTIFTN